MRNTAVLANLGIAVFALIILPASANNTYPTEYKQGYLKDCMTTSMKEGLAEPEAQKLCDCTLAEFQKQYSVEEFEELNAKAQTDQNSANALIEVGEFCFESILYE